MRTGITVIVPAGGASVRFGSGRSKLLEEILEKPVIQHTVDRIRKVRGVSRIIVPCPRDGRSVFEGIFDTYSEVLLIDGGSTRQESVKNALVRAEAEGVQDDDIVAVHDGARCCITPLVFEATVRAARERGAASAGVPLTDSIKEVNEEGAVVASLDREKLWIVQTPQVFRFGLLKDAHSRGETGATDDAGLVEAISPVFMVRGDYTNIKITSRGDLDVAALVLMKGPENAGVTF